MSKKELLKRIELLEARVSMLEAQLAANPFKIKINYPPAGGTTTPPFLPPWPNIWYSTTNAVPDVS